MIVVNDAYQEFMDAERIKRNEAKIKTQETKATNAQKDLYFQRSVIDLLKGELKEADNDEGGIRRLDRMPPSYEEVYRQFYGMVNDRSYSSFTVTFNPVIRDSLDELGSKRLLKNFLKNVFYEVPADVYTILIPDCDEGGNFHYHGVIKMPIKYRPKFKKIMTKNIGFVKIKYITDPEGWTKYCFKDIYTEKDITDLYISL